MIQAVDLTPLSKIVVTVYSDPQVLLNDSVDANGEFAATVYLPEDLEDGGHTLVISGLSSTGPIDVVGAFNLNDEGEISRMVQPAIISDFSGPSDSRLERALETGKPVWDVDSRPLTTAAIAVAAVSMLGLAGATGVARAPSTASGMGTATSFGDDSSSASDRRQNSRGKLSGVVTKKLKGLQIESSSRGDISGTWARPGTERTDEFSRSAPNKVGRFSAVAPRVLVDGAWLRAIFGSFGYIPWVVGGFVGVLASFVGTNSPMTPMFGLLLVLIVLGILDAAAGAVAWIVILLCSAVTGWLWTWPDVRTVLGFGVVLVSIPLLAHVIRPLRRYVASNSTESWERVFDYVMMPVFVAFASGSALKALNGLSGLELITMSQVSTMRWVVAIAIMTRLGFEDLAAHWYPERMKIVQPTKLVSPGKSLTGLSIAIRTGVFLMVAEPFFGITSLTILAATLLAIPQVLKIWEDDLPNSPMINKWFPRGLFRFLCLLVLGAYLSSVFIGPDKGDEAIKSSFVWLLLPGVIVGVIELFGRSGGNWPNVTLRRSLGAIVWLMAAALVTGRLVLFA